MRSTFFGALRRAYSSEMIKNEMAFMGVHLMLLGYISIFASELNKKGMGSSMSTERPDEEDDVFSPCSQKPGSMFSFWEP